MGQTWIHYNSRLTFHPNENKSSKLPFAFGQGTAVTMVAYHLTFSAYQSIKPRKSSQLFLV
jgi:hypothetical protein